MLLEAARGRRLIFLGGKGGVGKTTLAAAIAAGEADRGRRVLLVSTDPAHNLGHLFDRRIGPRPVAVAAGLEAVELDPEATVDEHLSRTRSFLRRMMPERLRGEIDKHLDQSREAPGMVEAALLEAMAEIIAEAEHDLLVFDTAPSGHTARLMALPEMMAAWTEGLIAGRDRSEEFAAAASVIGGSRAEPPGDERDRQIRSVLHRRRKRFADLRAALTDQERTAFLIVLTAERLPVLETAELHEKLRQAGVAVPALIVNKRAPEGQGAFMDRVREREAEHLADLARRLPEVPVIEVPLQPEEVTGLDAVTALAGRRA